MSKKIKLVAERKPPEPLDDGMTMDRIIAQMGHVKYHALTFLEGSGKAGEIGAEWKADIKAHTREPVAAIMPVRMSDDSFPVQVTRAWFNREDEQEKVSDRPSSEGFGGEVNG